MFFSNFNVVTVFDVVSSYLRAELASDYLRYSSYWAFTSEDLVCASFAGTIKIKGYDYDSEKNRGEKIGSGDYSKVYARGSDVAKKYFRAESYDETLDTELSALKEFLIFLAMYPAASLNSFRLAIDLDDPWQVRMTLPRLPGKVIENTVEPIVKESREWAIIFLYALRSACIDLERLHGFGITHGDINLKNIIGEGRSWHLIDFGSAQFGLESVFEDLEQLSKKFREVLPEGSSPAWGEIVGNIPVKGLRQTIIALDAEIGFTESVMCC